MNCIDNIIKKLRENKSLREEYVWIGGAPSDDDLFHDNAKRLGLTVHQEDIYVQGKPLEFDYVVLKNPITLYHATTEDKVHSILEKGLLPQGPKGGKYISGVFLSGSKESSYKWRGPNSVVLQVSLPVGTKLYQDRQSNAVFVRDKVPASQIKLEENE